MSVTPPLVLLLLAGCPSRNESPALITAPGADAPPAPEPSAPGPPPEPPPPPPTLAERLAQEGFVPLEGPTDLRHAVDGAAWALPDAAGPLPAEAWWTRDPAYRDRVGQPPRVVDGRVVANDSYKDVWMVEDRLHAWHALHPDVTRVGVIGLSHQGRPILALRITDHPDRDEDEPAVLLTGSLHGHEFLSTDLAFRAIEEVLDGPGRPWVEGLDLWVVPLVNPDGSWWTLRALSHPKAEIGRKNGRDTNGDGAFTPGVEGVDLNRNFPFGWGLLGEEGSRTDPESPYFRGPAPGSEPETQALLRLAGDRRFVASISFHTNGTMVMSPYTIRGLANPEPDLAWAVAEALAGAAPAQANGRRFAVKRMMYPVDGTDQDHLFHAFGTLAYILELSHHNPLDLSVREDVVTRSWPFVAGLLDRVLGGPAVVGHVRDPEGRPLEATISLLEIQHHEGEDWRSHPRDGRFHRLLTAAGTWTVEARAPGFAPTRQEVQVTEDGPVVLDLVLHPESAAGAVPPG